VRSRKECPQIDADRRLTWHDDKRRWLLGKCRNPRNEIILMSTIEITISLLKFYNFRVNIYNMSNRIKTWNLSNSVKIRLILWVWPISSFNPQKLKNLLPPCPSSLTLHYIVPTPQSLLSPLPKSQIFNLNRLTLALENLGYEKALYCILDQEGMIGGLKLWKGRGRWWGIKWVK